MRPYAALSDAAEAAPILMKEVTRSEPVPLPEAVLAADNILSFGLGQAFPLPVSQAKDLNAARALCTTHQKVDFQAVANGTVGAFNWQNLLTLAWQVLQAWIASRGG